MNLMSASSLQIRRKTWQSFSETTGMMTPRVPLAERVSSAARL